MRKRGSELMVEAYPLYWPEGWQRTLLSNRKRNYLFKKSFAANRDELMEELRRLGASSIVLSTNIPLRRDGLPMAAAREPADSGIAVYFTYKKCQMCFACDSYQLTAENIRAISLTVSALRGIERWGASDMIERAFRGFLALPGPEQKKDWRTVLGFQRGERPTLEVVESAFREKAHLCHPDKGGSSEAFSSITAAREQAKKELRIEK